MSGSFNIRKFYKESKSKEEEEFCKGSGMSIRYSFQQYNEGGDNEEVFVVKSLSQKTCFGIEFHGSISYLLPINRQEAILLIFDESLMTVVEELSNWSESRLSVYERYAPLLITSMLNASQGKLATLGIFIDEEMLCFAKQIKYPIFDKIKDGYIVEPELINKILALVQYRNLCVEEVTSFDGFSDREEKEIVIKEGISIVKKGLRYKKFMDFVISFDSF